MYSVVIRDLQKKKRITAIKLFLRAQLFVVKLATNMHRRLRVLQLNHCTRMYKDELINTDTHTYTPLITVTDGRGERITRTLAQPRSNLGPVQISLSLCLCTTVLDYFQYTHPDAHIQKCLRQQMNATINGGILSPKFKNIGEKCETESVAENMFAHNVNVYVVGHL